MPFTFKRSKRYLDAQSYRQAYKAFILDGGKWPVIPDTLTKKEVEKIQAIIKRLYTQ